MHPWMKRGLAGAAVLIASLSALAAWVSAGDHPLMAKTPTSAQAGEISLPPVQAPAGLGFSILRTGESRGALEALIVGGGSWFTQRHPAQIAVLVRHPKATFLFDSGLGRQVDQQFAANGFWDRQFFAYRDVQPAVDQLAKAGWGPERVRMIVPSHMHWDHISALPDFPEAEVWVQDTERDHAEHGHAPAFLASQFKGVRHWHTLNLSGGRYMGFERSLDLFGDGSVVLVPLPGHTAGQVGMFLSLPSGQRYFFTGDVTWTLDGLQRPADRSWLLCKIVHVDQDEAANQAAIVQVHQLMQRFPALKVVPAHDERVIATLPRFPQFQQ